jgi:hypothetical protein
MSDIEQHDSIEALMPCSTITATASVGRIVDGHQALGRAAGGNSVESKVRPHFVGSSRPHPRGCRSFTGIFLRRRRLTCSFSSV